MSARGSQTRERDVIPTRRVPPTSHDHVHANAARVAIDPWPRHACDPQHKFRLFRRPSAAVFSTATPVQRAPSDAGTPRTPKQSPLHAQGPCGTFVFQPSGSVCCRPEPWVGSQCFGNAREQSEQSEQGGAPPLRRPAGPWLRRGLDRRTPGSCPHAWRPGNPGSTLSSPPTPGCTLGAAPSPPGPPGEPIEPMFVLFAYREQTKQRTPAGAGRPAGRQKI